MTAVAHEHARPYLPGALTGQIDQMLGQLRLGQVSAESHAGQQGQPEENDLDRAPAPPPTGAAQLRRPPLTLRRYLMSRLTYVNRRYVRLSGIALGGRSPQITE